MVEKYFHQRRKRMFCLSTMQEKRHCRERMLRGSIKNHLLGLTINLSYSYRFIEESIRNGTLERLSDHAVGPPIGTIRAVGSSTHPAKTGRQKFTEDDDRFLLKWVRSSLRKGARTQGNEIYKQLEEEVCHSPTNSSCKTAIHTR